MSSRRRSARNSNGSTSIIGSSSHFTIPPLGPPWPSDAPSRPSRRCLARVCGPLRRRFDDWTYSYMNPVFARASSIHETNDRFGREGRLSNISVDDEDVDAGEEEEDRVVDHRRELSSSDLYRAPLSMRASTLQPIFDSLLATDETSLTLALWKIARPSFLPAGACQFVAVVAQIAVPLFVWRLLKILEGNPSNNVFAEAIPWAIAVLVADVCNAFALNRQRFLAMQSGVIVRVSLLGGIYDRVLRLSPRGKIGLTTGAVSNLFAIDAQKLFEVAAEGHLLWSAPLSMILVAGLLVWIVGPSMAVGIVLLLLFAPMVQKISNRMMEIRKERVKLTDCRVEIVNAMLQGIKVTKLNNYEERYVAKIEKVRNEELSLLRQELYVWSMAMAVQFISPVVASIGAFAAYVFAGNVLTTADAFTALLLFNGLRFPINYASRLIGKMAQARESGRRIGEFMRRDVLERRMEVGNKDEEGIAAVPARRASACNGSLEHITEDISESIRDELYDATPLSEEDSSSHHEGDNLLVIENGTFRIGASTSWENVSSGEEENGFVVQDINISLRAGEILAIVGPVGSGKTTIINAIIGEVAISPTTTIATRGRVAYASQVAFILNATLRDNILFGNAFDAERYNQVLDDCCLRADIEQLSAGDMTEIGERGVTLSGGQKQRVSLARVVYSNPDIALFDDPLSALDAGTNRRVFNRLFKQVGNKLLSKTAVVLVTHASHFLHLVDRIMVVVDGGVSFSGSWGELSRFKTDDPKSKLAIESIQNAVQEGGGAVHEDKPKIPSSNHSAYGAFHSDKQPNLHMSVTEALMSREARQHGKTRLWTWTLWFREAGGLVFTGGVLTAFALEKLFYFATEWWMTRWTHAIDEPIMFLGIEFPPQSDGVHSQHGYLIVYAIFMLLGFICAFLRTVWIVHGGVKCSRNLYSTMTSCVLHAPMIYFETTPMGRLLNRFTHDAEILDITLVWSMSMLLISASWFLTGVIVIIGILPWMILAMIPVAMVYWMIQNKYRKSGADLQRIDALSRSPLQAMLAEGIEGSATIRSFRKEETFTKRFHSFVDRNISAQLNFISAQRWLGIRIELLGVTIVFTATLLVIVFNEVFGLSAGLVALLIRWSSSLTISLSFFMDNAAETEGAITAIERIKNMSETPQEPNFERTKELSDPWPSKGELEFRDVQMRYRSLLPLALDGLSFRVEAGKHCGVVGRTGAGKSSLSVAMFRLVEVEAGAVLVDGVDLSTLGLSDVRGRPNGIAIIPQDPFLFAGTMRECLDPFNACTDEKLLEALLSVRMLGPGKGKEFLDTHVEEGGANYSVGERSLLVLARAMLARPKLLVMDEATANIDGETDNFIQKMLRIRFVDTTLITIAHRLDTIMDYDVVLVMSDGKAAEFGPPAELLELNGVFSELVNAAGEGAASLIAMAKKAAEKKAKSM